MSEEVDKIVSNLKTMRDELKLQMHLAQAELRDEWEELEPKFEEMEGKLSEAAEDTREVVNVVAEELLAAYKRIKDRL